MDHELSDIQAPRNADKTTCVLQNKMNKGLPKHSHSRPDRYFLLFLILLKSTAVGL